jgi:UDPglucose 6-dehydrogenase
MRPDRVVIGVESDRAAQVLRQLYRPLFLLETPIVETTLETAEIAKYAANSFLATKITFINEVADFCEKANANVQDVARAIGLDGRIGRKFLHAGPGYGGSCFPKDTLAFATSARDFGAPQRVVEQVVAANEDRKRQMADRVVAACGGSVAGKTIAMLGLAFKPNTDDMRAAPSLDIVPLLQQKGANIRAYDPAAMEEAADHLTDVAFCRNAYDAMEGADCAVIVTEWNEFRALDLDRLKALLASPVLIDMRNIYEPAEMVEAGITYHSVGRPPV